MYRVFYRLLASHNTFILILIFINGPLLNRTDWPSFSPALTDYEVALFAEPYANLEQKIRTHAGLARALDALAERYGDERLTVTDLARVAGMCPTAFRDRFRRIGGMTPRQFIIRYRINKALYWLSQGLTDVCEIAGRVGFADVSGLRKSFKSVLGANPSALMSAITGRSQKKVVLSLKPVDLDSNS